MKYDQLEFIDGIVFDVRYLQLKRAKYPNREWHKINYTVTPDVEKYLMLNCENMYSVNTYTGVIFFEDKDEAITFRLVHS